MKRSKRVQNKKNEQDKQVVTEKEVNDDEEEAKTKSGKSTALQKKKNNDIKWNIREALTANGSAATVARKLNAQLQKLKQLTTGGLIVEEGNLLGKDLSSDGFLDHSDLHVRLLVACCVAELLRITAPESPFGSDHELRDVFSLMIRVLQEAGVSSSTREQDEVAWYGLLETLATVKSCNLIVGLEVDPDDDEADAVELIVKLFRCLFERLQDDHSTQVQANMVSIMVGCLEESDFVSPALLDVLLEPLLPGKKNSINGKTSRAYSMAQSVIQNTKDVLVSHLSLFCNSILVDSSHNTDANGVDRVQNANNSELKDDIYLIIYELHKIMPQLLNFILPNLCMQLQIDETQVRSNAIALLGRLFASSHANYAVQYTKNFKDFLHRFHDLNKEIRMQMVQVCAIIYQLQPEVRSDLKKELMERLNDTEPDVRRLVVNELCDLAVSYLEIVDLPLLQQIGERMKDKKVIIRKEAMTGLATVFNRHISSSSWSKGDYSSNKQASKLMWIPDYVLKCYAYPQQELKVRCLQLLDDILLPKQTSSLYRVKGLVAMYQYFDALSKEALKRIFLERAQCCRMMVECIQYKLSSNNSDISRLQMMLENFIVTFLPETDQITQVVTKLLAIKDKNVWKYLQQLCDYNLELSALRNARDELLKCVGSKSIVGDCFKNICRKLCMTTLNSECMEHISSILVESIHEEDEDEYDAILELLLLVNKTLPELLEKIIPKLSTIITVPNATDSVLKQVLHLLKLYGKYKFHTNASTKSSSSSKCSHTGSSTSTTRSSTEKPAAMPTLTQKFKKKLFTLCQVQDKNDFDITSEDAVLIRKLSLQCCYYYFAITKEYTDIVRTVNTTISWFITNKTLNTNASSAELLYHLQAFSIIVKHSNNMALNTVLSSDQYVKYIDVLMELFLQNDDLSTELQDNVLNEFNSSRKSNTISSTKKITVKATKSTSKTSSKTITASMLKLNFETLSLQVIVHLLFYQAHIVTPDVAINASSNVLSQCFQLLQSNTRFNYTSVLQFKTLIIKMIFKLLHAPDYESTLSISNWHYLGYMTQDNNMEIRDKTCQYINKLTLKQKNKVSFHKYLCYYALYAMDQNVNLRKTAKSMFTQAIQRVRRICEAQGSAQMSTNSTNNTNSNNSSNNEEETSHSLLVPEYILPYLVHLLSHHPKSKAQGADSTNTCTNSSGSSVKEWEMVQVPVYLSFVLDGLVSSVASEADNISFLLQIVYKMNQCHDAFDAGNQVMYRILHICSTLIRHKIRNQVNLKAYPGKLFLPKQLYQPGSHNQSKGNQQDVMLDDKIGKQNAINIKKLNIVTKNLTNASTKRKSPVSATSKKAKVQKVETPTRRMPSRRVKPTNKSLADKDSDEDDEEDVEDDASELSRPQPKKSPSMSNPSDDNNSDSEEMSSFQKRSRRAT